MLMFVLYFMSHDFLNIGTTVLSLDQVKLHNSNLENG